VLVLAASQAQAQVVFRYALGFLEASPVLRQEIASTTTQEVRLRSGIIIAVHANSYRTVRGKTLLTCIFDEVAFWRDETTATPDIESYRAVLPSLARTGGMLVGISTGYRKTGLLYQKHRQHYGQNDDRVLVVQGSALDFNPTLDVAVIAAASAADPEAAIAEWEGGFRCDLATFLDDRAIEDCIDHRRPLELPPRRDVCYRAFTDPSGGRTDHFTLAIGHKENDNRMVVDVLRGVVPSDPYGTVHEYAALLREYSVGTVTGDNYAAAWVETAFRNAGVLYHRSELPKSALYLTTLPLFMRGAVAMPEHNTLIRELKLLERRVSRVGKDIVDHARHGTDDFANAVCGVLHGLSSMAYDTSLSWVCDDDDLRLVGRMPVIAW
jgi:hypothetical protein